MDIATFFRRRRDEPRFFGTDHGYHTLLYSNEPALLVLLADDALGNLRRRWRRRGWRHRSADFLVRSDTNRGTDFHRGQTTVANRIADRGDRNRASLRVLRARDVRRRRGRMQQRK